MNSELIQVGSRVQFKSKSGSSQFGGVVVALGPNPAGPQSDRALEFALPAGMVRVYVANRPAFTVSHWDIERSRLIV